MNRDNKMIVFLVILGFGLGIIISSVINSVYPIVKYKEYSEQKIIEEAKKLGMIEKEEYEKLYKKIAENESVKEEVVENSEVARDVDEKYLTIRINKDETSEMIVASLYEEGIIRDKKEFIEVIINKNVEKKLKYGVFKIKENQTYDEIIDILCGK